MNSMFERVKSNIQKERLLSLSNFFVMTVSFLILGIFISVVVSTQTALRALENQAQVTIFFKDDFPETNILAHKATLEADSRIDSVNYISKEDAYKLFTEINKDEPILLDSVSASILPASLELRAHRLSDLNLLADEYTNLDGVEDVKFFADVIANFRVWSTIVYIAGLVLVVVFFVISYSVVLATLRATINSKGTEYEIMKLVGASDDYVKRPLVYQGIFFGLVSSALAGLILFLVILVLKLAGLISLVSFAFLYGVSLNPLIYALILAIILLLSGYGLGYLGSSKAIKRYLEY